jgi:leader peptidase (prepilin peptidase)/N-methyltransferase
MNVLIYRLPLEKSIVSPGSACPNCGYHLKFYDNIPIISYLLLGGKCRKCKQKISIQYPIIELITALLFIAVYLKFGLTLLFVKYAVFIFLLSAAAFTDLFTAFDKENFECGIIPDEISIGGTIIGIIISIFTPLGLLNSVIGAAVGFLILFLPAMFFKIIMKKEGMGGGDIKLFMMIGAFLGWQPMFFVLFVSSLLGTIIGIPFILLKKDKEYMIPFGPFISLSTLIYIFYGKQIINLYLQMLYHN